MSPQRILAALSSLFCLGLICSVVDFFSQLSLASFPVTAGSCFSAMALLNLLSRPTCLKKQQSGNVSQHLAAVPLPYILTEYLLLYILCS